MVPFLDISNRYGNAFPDFGGDPENHENALQALRQPFLKPE